MLRGGKCKVHGGMASGARTPETRAAAIKAAHDVRHSTEGRQAHSELVRSMWRNPEHRLRVTQTRAARMAKRDLAFVMAARQMGLGEIDRRAAWAKRRRDKRNLKIRALEAQIATEAMNARIAADLGLKLG